MVVDFGVAFKSGGVLEAGTGASFDILELCARNAMLCISFHCDRLLKIRRQYCLCWGLLTKLTLTSLITPSTFNHLRDYLISSRVLTWSRLLFHSTMNAPEKMTN